MQKAASMASALVLIFPPAVLILGCLRAKFAYFEHPTQVVVNSHSCANLLSVLAQCSTGSVASTVVMCIISTDVLIIGLCTAVLNFWSSNSWARFWSLCSCANFWCVQAQK